MSLFQTSLTPITLHLSSATTRLRRTATTSFPVAALSSQPSPPEPEPKPKPKPRPKKPKPAQNPAPSFPGQVPRKPRRGRRSEAQAVEDYVRSTLERTFAAIREQDPEAFENIPSAIRERKNDDDDDDDVASAAAEEEAVVEEESEEWPVDAEVGWGIRSSEYFEKHPIKNVVDEDGFEIDWEGEIDDNWVKEINCLEWESFVFHPSPIVVLVFERYNRASENWKALKELEKAVKVYWESRDRLPPRSVKIDINIEKDLAYALKVQEGPQILFLRGTRILYREKEFRTADELVQMIAHFYYKAKRPSYVRVSAKS